MGVKNWLKGQWAKQTDIKAKKARYLEELKEKTGFVEERAGYERRIAKATAGRKPHGMLGGFTSELAGQFRVPSDKEFLGEGWGGKPYSVFEPKSHVKRKHKVKGRTHKKTTTRKGRRIVIYG